MSCIYAEFCLSVGDKCRSCKNNPKQDYYEPIDVIPKVIPWPFPPNSTGDFPFKFPTPIIIY